MVVMDRLALEQMLNQGMSLAEIGRRFDRHESTVAYWVQKYGLEAVNQAKVAPRGGLERSELERLVSAHMSISEIADTVERSNTTVRHWLREYGLRTRQAKRLRAMRGCPERVVLDCPKHGSTEFRRRAAGGYRCLKCRAEAVARRRRRIKQILVEDAGGACVLCGYDRCVGALHFHHLQPAEKAFALSHRGVARSLARARAEARKCVLLCSNCHAEVELGIASIGGDARLP
ncbi:MAG TPA: helix-turn-helix domain-containing protein [Solirubrobacteraceae bacterium]|nr:helix-turn-helix domain-containing protein [Solirubrobacteraceae bacterium]